MKEVTKQVMDDALLKKWQKLATDSVKFAKDRGFEIEDIFMANMIIISAFCAMKKIPEHEILKLLDTFRHVFEKIEDELDD
jgi:Pyruvate/2-oxoacid:ferredoxin oxidoreductase gamma subunit